MFHHNNAAGLKSGENVRIRRRIHSPNAGLTGLLTAIEPNDPYAPCLVHFNDGTQFRYGLEELDPQVSPSPHFYERAIRTIIELSRTLRT